jgi:hypothetical protein
MAVPKTIIRAGGGGVVGVAGGVSSVEMQR